LTSCFNFTLGHHRVSIFIFQKFDLAAARWVKQRKMLTRNLYDLEEVKTSLTLSLLIGKTRTALYWAQEILASECGYELGGVLLHFWIHYCCPNDFFLPKRIRELDFDGDLDKEIVAVIMRLATCKKTNLVMEIIVDSYAGHPWPCYKAKTTKEELMEARRRSKICGLTPAACFSIVQALDKGYVSRAWYIASRLDLAAVAKLIRLFAIAREKNVIECLLDLSDTETFQKISLVACFIILAGTWGSMTLIEYGDIPGLMLSVNSWIKSQGKRQGRIHSTEKKADIRQLYDIYPCLVAATPFWQRIIAGYDLNDDTTKEKFYETWFPNDIPDEWSLEDQQKSHGTPSPPETDPLAFAAIYYKQLRKSRNAGRYKKIMLGKDFRNMDAV
jgi:hypothetical protein